MCRIRGHGSDSHYKGTQVCFCCSTLIFHFSYILLYLKLVLKVLDNSQPMENIPEWFHGVRLNFAENLLRFDDEKVALYSAGIK